MSTTYTVVCCDPLGQRLDEIAAFVSGDGGAGLQYVLTCAPGGIGALQLTVPATVPLSLFPKDGRLIPYRSIAGRSPAMDNGKVYLIQRRQSTANTTTITAIDATSILQRRIIAYYAGSSQAQKAAAAAGNQIKAFAREQLTALAGTRYGDTTGGDVSAYLSVQADLGDGQSIAKAAAWRSLHDVAADLAQASATLGTYLTFEIVAPTESTLELRTAASQRGIDRRAGTATPMIFAEATGNLTGVELDEDWSSEVTYPYMGGTGDGIYRGVNYTYIAADVTETPFARKEHFYENTTTADSITLRDGAAAQLFANRARVVVTGDLIETPAATRGLHFDLGDFVTVAHRGVQYDVRLDTIHVAVGGARNQLAGDAPLTDTQRITQRLIGRGD